METAVDGVTSLFLGCDKIVVSAFSLNCCPCGCEVLTPRVACDMLLSITGQGHMLVTDWTVPSWLAGAAFWLKGDRGALTRHPFWELMYTQCVGDLWRSQF